MARDRLMNGPTHEKFVRSHLRTFIAESAYLASFAEMVGAVDRFGGTNQERFSPVQTAVAFISRVNKYGWEQGERPESALDQTHAIREAISGEVRILAKKSGRSEKVVERNLRAMANIVGATVDDISAKVVAYEPSEANKR